MKTYFPILIRFSKTGVEQVVNHPEEIPQGEEFTVLKTNVREHQRHNWRFLVTWMLFLIAGIFALGWILTKIEEILRSKL